MAARHRDLIGRRDWTGHRRPTRRWSGEPITVFLCVAVVAALAIAGCGGGRAAHSDAVARQVKSALSAKVGQTPKSVTCPHDLDAKVGATLTCKLTAADGTWLYVYVRVDRVSDNRAHFTIRASTKVHQPSS